MRRAYLLALSIAAIAPAPFVDANAPEPTVTAQVPAAVVRVLSVDDAERYPPFGSGWIGETGVVLTSEGHVVANAGIAVQTNEIVVISADGRR